MTVTRDVHSDGWRARLDLSRQVLALDVPELAFGWPPQEPSEEPLLPTPPDPGYSPVSAALMLMKAKQFDDGLVATVDQAAQFGAGKFPGKASLLRSLASSLPASGNAAATMFAACKLGDVSIDTPAVAQEAVARATRDFLSNERASKPLGFYTWTPGLSAIFRQDRFLQQLLDSATADALAHALDSSPDAAAVHDMCLRLAARLSNPLVGPGLRHGRGRRAFFPASRSHEQMLLERLFGDLPIPEGFDLMTELIGRVRSGNIDLATTEESGWYDHQTWSLEPLIEPDRMPEAKHQKLGDGYRKHLEDLFRGALALTRETQVKQLAVAMGGCAGPSRPPLYVRPALNVEPLPSHYARRAASYRFVRAVLEDTFGPAWAHLHRLTEQGPVSPCLGEEVTRMEQLFDGAAGTARRELGMDALPGDEESGRHFATWRCDLAKDEDLGQDSRMMVPVYFDLQRRKTKVWAFLGWQTVLVEVEYEREPVILGIEPERPPEPEPTDRFSMLKRKYRKQPQPEFTGPPQVVFLGERYEFATPVLAEVYVSRLLNRDEFRRHCDQHRTRQAILANLE